MKNAQYHEFQYHVFTRALNHSSHSGPRDSQVLWGLTTSQCMSLRRRGSTCWWSTWPPSATRSLWRRASTWRCELPQEGFSPSLTGLSCLSMEWVLFCTQMFVMGLQFHCWPFSSDHVWGVCCVGTLLVDCLCTSLERHPQDSVLDWWALFGYKSSSFLHPSSGGVIFLGMVEKAMFLAEFQNINNSGQVKNKKYDGAEVKRDVSRPQKGWFWRQKSSPVERERWQECEYCFS